MDEEFNIMKAEIETLKLKNAELEEKQKIINKYGNGEKV